MFLSHLSLNHFRNYRRLTLDFERPLALIQGGNAQGKSNLLEAIYYLATSKSSHARAEREVVGWNATEQPIPFAQITGYVERSEQTLKLEILFTVRPDGVNYGKQIRINGVNRRSLDLVGQLRAVLFTPEDIVLVSGSPSERRRYLDIALCQIDRTYCQHLSRYQKIVTQRNSLLKQLRESATTRHGPNAVAQLGFWDEQLIEHGAAVIARRYAFLSRLAPIAQQRHVELSNDREQLDLCYFPSFNPGMLSPRDFERLKNGQLTREIIHSRQTVLPQEQIAEHFQVVLDARRDRELIAGTTLYGPHRDDVVFLVNDRDLRTYGSRGQQRTAALALKLAELQAMSEETNEAPILLLDDVMSELDVHRRNALVTALQNAEQVIATTTDWDDFSAEFRNQAQLLEIESGIVRPAEAAA
jgi:DNA replication and repair protein RecF